MVMFLFSNVSQAADYSLSYSGSTATWKNSSGTTISAPTLQSTDSVTLTAGTWPLSASITLKGVRLEGGVLGLGARTLTSRVTISANAGITAATSGTIGKVTGTVFVTGGTLTVSNSTTFRNLVLIGGSLSFGSNTLTSPVLVASTATITGTGTIGAVRDSVGTLTLVGAMTTSSIAMKGGNLINASNVAGAITVSATDTISGAGSVGNINISSNGNLILGSNKSSGSLTLSGGNIDLVSYKLITGGDLTISANGTIKSNGAGIVDLNSNNTAINGGNLTLDNAELITDNLSFSSTQANAYDVITIGSGVLSFEKGSNSINNVAADRHINGTVRIYLDNNSKTLTAHVGNGSVYAPVALSFNGKDSLGSNLSSVSGNYGAHYVTIKYFDSKNNITTADNTLPGSASGDEYWSVTRSSTKPAASLTFRFSTVNTGTTFSKTRIKGTLDTANLRSDIKVATIDLSTNKWTALTTTYSIVPASNYVTIQTSTITPNSSFTIGSNNVRSSFLVPLPVSLIDFAAKANDASIEVKWSTASEKDNSAFVLEKSLDGQTWSAIGTVKGAKTSNVVNNYGIVDYKAVAGFQYYRLKQIDLDGTVNYSKAIAVNFSKASTLNVNLFPNPAKDALNITTENNATGEVNIQILNSMGETVYKQVLEAGLVQSIDITSFIPGVYYVTVIAEGESKIIRLLKN